MGRGWKIASGLIVVVISMLAINTLLVSSETKPAAATVPGAQLLDLSGGEVQALTGGIAGGDPIVLVHCFTCAIDWWDGMRPSLEREHRVIATDLLGHGGSAKPGSGYGVAEQADLLAEALRELGAGPATVVGHSLGGAVAVALAERHPDAVTSLVIVDTPSAPEAGDLGFIASLGFVPVIGQAGWRLKTDGLTRDGLEVAFAPGYPVPDRFVDDVNRMTYTAYTRSADAFDEYTGERSLAARLAPTHKPVLVLMGAEEQIVEDPAAALAAYERELPDVRTHLIPAAGHSPNVERPALVSQLVRQVAN